MNGDQGAEVTGVTRSNNIVLKGPPDEFVMSAAMQGALERARGTGAVSSPSCLVVTATVEQALVAAQHAREILSDESRVVPVSSVGRARRVLAMAPVTVVTGTASNLLALRSDSALRLESLGALIVIGLDKVMSAGAGQTLQALLADVEGEFARVVTLEEDSPETDGFIESQLRRPRRITPQRVDREAEPEEKLAMPALYALTTVAGKHETLRTILDAVDPPSVMIVVDSDNAEKNARAALSRLGLVVGESSGGDERLIQVVRSPSTRHVALVVLWNAPDNRDKLAEAMESVPVNVVTLLLAEQLVAFRDVAGERAAAWVSPAVHEKAQSRAKSLRESLERIISEEGGSTASELALLAPLLEKHDAVEVAAAALRLNERTLTEMQQAEKRRKLHSGGIAAFAGQGDVLAGRGSTSSSGTGGLRTVVFLAIGKRDGVRVGDIVGAVANEAGIDGSRIGQVQLFESHSLIELDSGDAAKAVAALSTATLRGRKMEARIDTGGSARGEGSRGGPSRGGRSGGDFRDGPRGGGRSDSGRHGAGGRGDAPRGGASRGGSGRDSGARGGSARSGGARSDSGAGGGSFGARSERGERGGDRTSDRGGRPFDDKRAFGDRPAQERTEGRQEWSERGERLNNARRAPREDRVDPETAYIERTEQRSAADNPQPESRESES